MFPPTTPTTKQQDKQPWVYDHCIVTRVIDGDTVDALIDFGFDVFHAARFRLDIIDTPERGEAGYDEATQALKDLIASAKALRIETRKNKRDGFGRYFAVLSDAVDGRNFNQIMLDLGHAKIYKR